MVKKLLSVSLLLCFCIPFLASYTLLELQKKQVKRGIKKRIIATIDKDELVYLSFSRKEAAIALHWEHSKEFEFKGQMYDVVAHKYSADSVSYWCWWDTEETDLNKQLKKLLAEALINHPTRKKSKEKVIDFVKKKYTISFSATTKLATYQKTVNDIYKEKRYCSITQIPPIPPPRVV